MPEVDFEAKSSAICGNDEFSLELSPRGANSMSYTIEVFDVNGILTHSISEDNLMADDPALSILDLITYLENVNGISIQNESQIVVTVEAVNDCATNSYVESYKYLPDVSYTIEYCNPMYYCGGNNEKEIVLSGNVDCVDCTYEWEGTGPGLSNSNEKFPTINTAMWDGAFSNEYSVTVTSPEGCAYCETVSIKNAPTLSFEIIQNCNEQTLEVTLHNPIEGTFVDQLEYLDVLTDQVIVLDHIGGLIYSFALGGSDYDLALITTEVLSDGSECFYNQDFDCMEGHSIKVKGYPLISPWAIDQPNLFGSFADINGNIIGFEPFHFTNTIVRDGTTGNPATATTACSNLSFAINDDLSSINYAELVIFSENGNRMFKESLGVKDDFEIQNGIDLKDLAWDGTFKGECQPSGVYVYELYVQSCYTGIDFDVLCTLPSGLFTGNMYNIDGMFLKSGDVTFVAPCE